MLDQEKLLDLKVRVFIWNVRALIRHLRWNYQRRCLETHICWDARTRNKENISRLHFFSIISIRELLIVILTPEVAGSKLRRRNVLQVFENWWSLKLWCDDICLILPLWSINSTADFTANDYFRDVEELACSLILHWYQRSNNLDLLNLFILIRILFL